MKKVLFGTLEQSQVLLLGNLLANGIVRAAYENLKFRSVENEKIIEGDVPDKDKGRVYFIGTEVSNCKYIGQSIKAFGVQGQANPVRYINI